MGEYVCADIEQRRLAVGAAFSTSWADGCHAGRPACCRRFHRCFPVRADPGLVAWGRTVSKVWGDFDVAKIRHSVELCTLYWHFLLGVWVVLFGLLFSGNNLDILLKLCGIR